MCGICGFLTRKEVNVNHLKKMNDTMFNRGPDDSGEEVYNVEYGYILGLAQRRLSILDLSPMGHQPMHSHDGRVSVVFNGEIYNYKEIRNQISDYSFQSNCDTEVIIAAYLKWGINCIEHFNGMFAIAIYDRNDSSLYLARDRMGKKPLYYWVDQQNMVFASELKPIMAFPNFQKSINIDIIPRYIYHQYINAPESIFKDVYKLEPGSCLRFQNGSYITWKYWNVSTVYDDMKGTFHGDYTEAKEELKRLLKESIRMRMISDVPLGMFLSGGYDSSLVTAVAQSISDHPVNTFAIGFNEQQYDEANYAKLVAESLGTKHQELYITEKDMLDLVDSIPKYYDEPFADSSQIPSMLVAKLAKKNVTVVLSGDGGDEIFCGYNIYELVRKAQKYDFLGNVVYKAAGLFGESSSSGYQKLPNAVRIVTENRNRNTKTQFSSRGYFEMSRKIVKDIKTEVPICYENESIYHDNNWQEVRMLLDMDTYLPGDILCKVDRATMKYSLEARCPLLDKNIIEFSFSLPHSFKFKHGNKKRILKDVAYDYIPRELLDRPKVGFGVPLDKWLRGPLKEQILDYTSQDFIMKQNIFSPNHIDSLVKNYMSIGDGGPGTGENYSKLVWSFLVFQKWYDNYF